MNGRYLLDTNIVIALFAQDNSATRRVAAAAKVLVPSIVIGELYYGAQRSGRVESNTSRIGSFAKANMILPCTSETARHYGEIKHALRLKSRPIPENGLWIAAVAQQHLLTLVTRDDHFGEIAGLSLERW